MQTHTHTKCTETAQRVTFNYSSHAQQSLHAHKNNPALDFLNKLTWATSSSMGGIPGKPLLFFCSSTPAKYFTVFFSLFFFLCFFVLLQASQPSPVYCLLLCNSCLSSHFILSSLHPFFLPLIFPLTALVFLNSSSHLPSSFSFLLAFHLFSPADCPSFLPPHSKKKTLMSIDLIGKRRKHVCVDVCMQMKCVCVGAYCIDSVYLIAAIFSRCFVPRGVMLLLLEDNNSSSSQRSTVLKRI